jgi:hypothetical protein
MHGKVGSLPCAWEKTHGKRPGARQSSVFPYVVIVVERAKWCLSAVYFLLSSLSDRCTFSTPMIRKTCSIGYQTGVASSPTSCWQRPSSCVVTRELRPKEMLCRSIVHLCYCIVLDLSRYPLPILQKTPDPKMMFLKLDAKHNDQLTSHPRTAHHYQPSIDIAKKNYIVLSDMQHASSIYTHKT